MKLMPISDIISELSHVSNTLQNMERIFGEKYTPALNAVDDARVYLRLFELVNDNEWEKYTTHLLQIEEDNPNLKFLQKLKANSNIKETPSE